MLTCPRKRSGSRQSPSIPRSRRLHLGTSYGALIQTVQSGSPAARAGLRAGNLQATLSDGITQQVQVGGDIIVAVDGRKISGASALEDAIVADHPGQVVTLGIVRGTKRLSVKVKLGTRPDVLPSQSTPQVSQAPDYQDSNTLEADLKPRLQQLWNPPTAAQS
jgi:S1-C subfamily serine protease